MIRKINEFIRGTFSFKQVVIAAIGLAIAFLSYQLRANRFSSFPPVGDTQDEIKYAFNGISLIKNGVPESWSWWDDYGKFPTIKIRGSDYRLVKPYFDEPPLFGLMSGAYAISKGMDSLGKVDAGAMRWPMIKLGAVNVFLLFILVCQLSGFLEAVIAALVYTTVPTFVLSSRLPLAENFLITLCLMCLIILWQYLRNKNGWLLFLCGFLSSMAILVKQVGIFLPLAIFFLLFFERKKREALAIGLFSLGAIGLWFLYGAHYDWNLFVRLLGKFSGREMRLPDMIIHLFDTFRIAEKTMSVDGWQIFGWISIVMFSFFGQLRGRIGGELDKLRQKMGYLMPTIIVGFYLALLMIMSGHTKGWYRFPLFPFVSWAIAVVFVHFLRKPSFLFTFFFASLALAASWIFGTGESFFSSTAVKIYQLVFLAALIPSLIYEIRKNTFMLFAARFSLLIMFVASIILNIRSIYFFQDQFWY